MSGLAIETFRIVDGRIFNRPALPNPRHRIQTVAAAHTHARGRLAALHFRMLYSRRDWIKYATMGIGSVALGHALRAIDSPPPAITVYKTPTCGCCKDWVAHLAKNGFAPTVHDMDDIAPIKRAMGIPKELESCHTAVVGRYSIEGHVPADLIQTLISGASKNIAGLAVPGMVAGSPGMETGQKQPYDVIAFTRDGKTSVFAHR
jgi:hypothetical protein